MVDSTIYCGNPACGQSLPPDVEPGTPCAACGSTKRLRKVALEASVTPRATLGYKARHPGMRKPFVEGITGASWSRKFGRWMQRLMHIDREANTYEEKVTDPATGEAIHHNAEPLSEHRGHGSAGQKD